MKTANDPRHVSRIKALEYLYAFFFNKNHHVSVDQQKPTGSMSKALVDGVIDNVEKIDGLLDETAPQWTVENMKLIDLVILRMGVYEGFLSKMTPVNVTIDEAIELGKEYGDENSSSFINGVLGALANPSTVKVVEEN